jgi:hypothetical protein
MWVLFHRKTLNVILSALALAALLVSVVPLPSAEAAPAMVLVTINRGWSKFSWVSSVRGGTLSVNPIVTAIDAPLRTLPTVLTLAATANVACPAIGNMVIPIRVYDFGKLVNTTSYTVDCSNKFAYTDPTIIHSPDEYANNPHYFHATISVPNGGAHNLVIETDLPSTDMLFWGYARVDTAPGTPLMDQLGEDGVIAATVINPPANAWIGVQWGDPTGTQWTMIDTWLNPLEQATWGRVSYGVEPKDFGTGPYRWVVYDNNPAQGGKLWGVSTPFFFPRAAHDWLWTQVRQTPVR